MLRVRTYSSYDLTRLIDLFRSTVRSVNRRDYTAEQTLAWAPDNIDPQMWAERLRKNRCWVATTDEIPVGFIELGPDGLIDMLYVHHANQRQGIGTRLLLELQQTGVGDRLAGLYTHSSITAVPFFERHGFNVEAAQQVTVRGQTLANFRMRKTF
jgi:putative acetyltransferase